MYHLWLESLGSRCISPAALSRTQRPCRPPPSRWRWAPARSPNRVVAFSPSNQGLCQLLMLEQDGLPSPGLDKSPR